MSTCRLRAYIGSAFRQEAVIDLPEPRIAVIDPTRNLIPKGGNSKDQEIAGLK